MKKMFQLIILCIKYLFVSGLHYMYALMTNNLFIRMVCYWAIRTISTYIFRNYNDIQFVKLNSMTLLIYAAKYIYLYHDNASIK